MAEQINRTCGCVLCKSLSTPDERIPSIDGEELSDAEINFIRLWRQGKVG